MYPTNHSGKKMHFKGLFFSKKIDPAFPIGQTDLYHFKKHYFYMYQSNNSGKNMHLKVLFFSKKNGPAFEIGRINPYDLKKHCFGCDDVITQAIT